MARKYEPVPGSGFYCWSLEKCEEEIFIVALGEIAGLIPPSQKWQRTLEYHFFELGKGLADEALIEMNGARKHHGLEPISIRETAVGDYACSRDEAIKSQRRRQTREELREAGPEVRAELFAQAKAEESGCLLPITRTKILNYGSFSKIPLSHSAKEILQNYHQLGVLAVLLM